jgi:glycosyltransferase involved in cell wall biosynthesis
MHISSVVNALRTLGHSVTVVSPPGIDPLNPANSIPVDKSHVRTRGIETLWKLISKYLPNFLFEIVEILYNIPVHFRLKTILASQKFDLIYERYAFYLVAGAFLAHKRGIPFVLEANEVSGIPNRARRQTFVRLCGFFERMLFRRCRGILTVSSYLRLRVLALGVPAEQVRVVPNAVDIEKFAAVRRDAGLAERLGLRGGRIVVVAGWFDRWDRLDFLVDALAKLVVQFPDLKLLVVGDGPGLTEMRERVSRLGLDEHLVFTGAIRRREVLPYLRLADVAVLPHSSEFGSPVVMFEFMGLRVPVVAPRLPPIEDVHVDGRTALLFRPLDLAELVAKVAAYLDSPELRGEIAGRAFEKLAREHTWVCNAGHILSAAGAGAPEVQG